MKHPRVLACSGVALVFALTCLFAASPQPQYALAQGSDPQSPAQPASIAATPLGTVFTYQGQLTDGGAPANYVYDFGFRLYDAATDGTQIGTKQSVSDVAVTDGLFTVQIDFGNGIFARDARWLEISVKADDEMDYITLAPRQPLTPAPYAIHASTLDWGQVWTGSGTGMDLTGSALGPIVRATNTYTVTGSGLAGISTASNGVYGETASTSGDKAGVYGYAAAAASGVYGESVEGDGVTGNGGESAGDFGGSFTGRAGVYGEGGTGVGGWFTSSSADALRAVGDVTITGDLTVEGSANIPNYAETVVVAKSGSDFAAIQAAIDSITDASAAKPYLVWVAAGVYSETVTLKPFVHLLGAGQEATLITSNVGDPGFPANVATLVLSGSTSVRDLSIENTGTSQHNIALLAPNSVVDVRLSDVTAWSEGATMYRYGVFVDGANTEVRLENVTARGEDCGDSYACYGLYVDDAAAVLNGGSYYGLPASAAETIGAGIVVYGSTATLDAEGVTALGAEAEYSYGLKVTYGAHATLRGGSFTARGGTITCGISVDGTGTMLTATAVTALAENGSYENRGLLNSTEARATLYGGSYTGRTSIYPAGIRNSGATLAAENVTAVADAGLGHARGLEIIAPNLGYPSNATVHGGSFTATNAGQWWESAGIYIGSSADDANLLADRVSSQSAGQNSYGLLVGEYDADVEISESVIRGDVNSVSVQYGSVLIANSRLTGTVSGTVTCVGVSSGSSFYTNTCP